MTGSVYIVGRRSAGLAMNDQLWPFCLNTSIHYFVVLSLVREPLKSVNPVDDGGDKLFIV